MPDAGRAHGERPASAPGEPGPARPRLDGDGEAAIRLYAEGVHRERAAAVGAMRGLGFAEELH